METDKPTTFAIPYVITLRQPILATALQGEPNSSVSFDYIPGSLIRGMFIQRYLKTHTTNDPLTGQGQALFFNGRVRYLNAYPIAMNQQRSLPTPTSLRLRKGIQFDAETPPIIYHTGHATWNAAKRRNAENGERLNPVAHPFCYLDATDGQVTFYTPERTLALHTQRNRHKGRATNAEGEIFRYEALTVGQTFCGAILIDAAHINDALIKEITKLGNAPDAWLGRSRSANYGQVDVSLKEPTLDWQEVTSEKGSSVQDSLHRYTLTLLSDMFLRDDGGHIIGAPDQATFHTTLEQYVSALNQTGHPITIKEIVWSHTCVASTIHGGFNRAWQLPLIQTRALTAGSMLTFTTTHEWSKEFITLLEAQGLGERRAEGFGRVVVNWNIPEQLAGLLPQTTEQTSTSKDTASDTVDLPKDASMLAQRMADRLQEAELAKAILLYLSEGQRLHGGVPNRTQLAYMRTLVQEAQHKEDVQALLAHIARLQNASTVASQQFERARLDKQPFLKWMTGLLERPTDVWEKLNLQKPPSIAGCSAQRNDTMSQSVVLRLFDAVLAQARRGQEHT